MSRFETDQTMDLPEAVKNVGFTQLALEKNADPMQTQTAVIKK